MGVGAPQLTDNSKGTHLRSGTTEAESEDCVSGFLRISRDSQVKEEAKVLFLGSVRTSRS